MPPTCAFFSYDIDDTAERIARERYQRFPNFHFIRKSLTDFSAADIGNQKIDLCFIDASHLFELNQITFKKLESSLAEEAIIAVHDTGIWMKPFFGSAHQQRATEAPGGWISETEYQQCPDERKFVNWILTDRHGFSEVHLHSKHVLRNGMTLIQKSRPLQTSRQI